MKKKSSTPTTPSTSFSNPRTDEHFKKTKRRRILTITPFYFAIGSPWAPRQPECALDRIQRTPPETAVHWMFLDCIDLPYAPSLIADLVRLFFVSFFSPSPLCCLPPLLFNLEEKEKPPSFSKCASNYFFLRHWLFFPCLKNSIGRLWNDLRKRALFLS